MPRRMIELLTKLRDLGFTDEDFDIVTHRKEKKVTIQMRINYCRGIGSFQKNGRMSQTKGRLEIVLSEFLLRHGSRPAKRGEFRAVAQDALQRIPDA